MEGLTIQQLIEMGGDTPLLVLMAYFLWKLDKNFATLASEIKLFMGLPSDDDNE